MAKKPSKLKPSQQIRRMVLSGELDPPVNVPDMLEQAGRLLDRSCSHEICGEVLFQAEDGKWYVGTVEFLIGRANPSYVVDTLTDLFECSNRKCGNIETMASTVVRSPGNPEDPLTCSSCGAITTRISLKKAAQMSKANHRA